MGMTKAELRSYYKQQRLLLDIPEQERRNQLLCIHFKCIPFNHPQRVLAFCAHQQQAEPDPLRLTDYLQQQFPQIQIAYPVVQSTPGWMEAVLPEGGIPFKVGKWGIAEPASGEVWQPETIDLVLVPLLIADKKGNRVGYGGGYYDRFLQRTKPDLLKVGVCFFEPIESITDTAQFDVPLSCCITPQGLYEF
jgi:5-formyltetrahydrofolate cyclo-ligase